jgi:hypothetical protein
VGVQNARQSNQLAEFCDRMTARLVASFMTSGMAFIRCCRGKAKQGRAFIGSLIIIKECIDMGGLMPKVTDIGISHIKQ